MSPAARVLASAPVSEEVPMRLLRALVISALVAAPFVRSSASARASLSVSFSGADEAPAGTGDPDGAGSGSIVLKTRTRRICWDLTYSNIDDPTKAHVHQGPVGQDGPVFITLFDGVAVPSPATGCVKAKRSLLRQIQKDPGAFYVNLHNAAYPDGAIRGQLTT
jgi:hypothetical protein